MTVCCVSEEVLMFGWIVVAVIASLCCGGLGFVIGACCELRRWSRLYRDAEAESDRLRHDFHALAAGLQRTESDRELMVVRFLEFMAAMPKPPSQGGIDPQCRPALNRLAEAVDASEQHMRRLAATGQN